MIQASYKRPIRHGLAVETPSEKAEALFRSKIPKWRHRAYTIWRRDDCNPNGDVFPLNLWFMESNGYFHPCRRPMKSNPNRRLSTLSFFSDVGLDELTRRDVGADIALTETPPCADALAASGLPWLYEGEFENR